MSEDLTALHWSVPESVIDQTLADMEVVANSGNVTKQEETKYLNDGIALAANLGPSDGIPPAIDPMDYYSTHLAGFVHGRRI